MPVLFGMKLSFSTNAFVRRSIVQAVESIAAIGYPGIELLADSPHLYADSVSESELSKLASVLDRTGLEVANINANTAVGYYGRDFWEPLFEPSIANPDPDLRRWRLDYSKKCIDMAQVLNARCVSLTSGKLVPGTPPDESLGLLIASLEELVTYAEKKAIRIGIEYEPGLIVECCEELAELLDRIDSPYLGANLDLGHSHVLKEDSRAVLRTLGKRVFHVHIEDIRKRKHYHLIPGTGDIDFPNLFAGLRSIGYTGFTTVELYTYPHEPETAAEQAFRYLFPILDRTT
ncbi:sugar phosphate isomerase/epimerase family protein [Desulfomonile tiedjei]|uniref:Sugar phosphate isomerase/epimerase n=1 Tax=Desulfomonile tiedjei (strain ATCC 49306 / DSM 6799 / DCB-1) TaxID=706587 RepID=I4CBN6_DESTA|nr:sugar phosphate isomerase/epimerase family protein [Desulfomonile tiedjei]AFM26977.1 sugar phosphate isomerase/epimerase [Desulfomonile tiedjei DSM 6799]